MDDLKKRLDKYLFRYYQYDVFHYTKDFKAPDWRKYKVEDVPDLVQLRKDLASRGLKDPWLRNEVWRYNPAFGPSTGTWVARTVFRGWKTGLVAAVTLYTINNVFFPEEHHDSDHH